MTWWNPTNGEVAGFAVWFLNYSTWTGTHGIFLEDLFITPTFRGHGYGKALLIHLAQECVAKGYHRLKWSVLDWNQPSIDFYLSLGAEAMDEWTEFRLTGEALSNLAGSSRVNGKMRRRAALHFATVSATLKGRVSQPFSRFHGDEIWRPVTL